jgi:ADP-ribosylglycohydrolase
MWSGYPDYFDKATKATLAHLAEGNDTGSASDELAGPARIAPLAAFLGEADEPSLVAAALEQTALTHCSSAAAEAAEFLARSSYRLLQGAPLDETLRMLAPGWAWNAAAKVLSLDAVEALGHLGRACPIPAALPAIIYLARRYGEDLETAFIENAMAGGDNCARGLALGILLGAAHGEDAIPERWRRELHAATMLESFLADKP